MEPRQPDIQTSSPRLGKELIFLTGCPRSGTTWLQLLISRHPLITSGPESYFFDSCIYPALKSYQNFQEREVPMGMRAYHTSESFLNLMRQFSYELLRPALDRMDPGQFFLEKSPNHTLALGSIRLTLPEAKLIHITRDPRAVCASLLAASKSWGANWAPRSAAFAALRWRHFYGIVKKGGHETDPHFFPVSYEELHRDTKNVLKRIFSFLGLVIGDVELESIIEKCAISELKKSGRGFQPLNESAKNQRPEKAQKTFHEDFFRKGLAAGWESDLSFLQIFTIELLTYPQMVEAGYQPKFRFLKWPAALLSGVIDRIFDTRRDMKQRLGFL